MHGLIALAGGTCSGKSTLADVFKERFSEHLVVLSEDSFYPDRSSLSDVDLSAINWDSIKSIDVNHLLNCLEELLSTGIVSVPIYDRVTHARLQESYLVSGGAVLLEGLHAITLAELLGSQGTRESSSKRLTTFIDCPESVRYQRRKHRELLNATIPGDFESYWRNSCEPTYLKEVAPQREKAEIILRHPIDTAIQPIIEWLSRNLR